jgi:hypothetical protein
MGFKVYQAEVKDTNRLAASAQKSEVFVSDSADKIAVVLTAPQGKSDAKPVKQTIDSFTVFINEKGTRGRNVIVQWDSSSSAQPPVAAPRDQPTTVATAPPAQWLVTKDDDNIKDNKIDAAFQAVTPSGWQTGTSVKFTTSMCSLDNFIVTYRYTLAG